MKRLLADTGGRPEKNEDLQQYIQNFQNLEGYFNELGVGDIILYGLEISGVLPNISVTGGVIYYNGKLRVVDAFDSGVYPIGMEATALESDARTFFDGVVKNTYETLKMTATGDGSGDIVLDINTPRWSTLFVTETDYNNDNTGVSLSITDISTGFTVSNAYGRLGQSKNIAAIEYSAQIDSDDPINGLTIEFDRSISGIYDTTRPVIQVWDDENGAGLATVVSADPLTIIWTYPIPSGSTLIQINTTLVKI